MINPLYLLWILILVCNLVFQILYFFNDRHNGYFWGKKITTPAIPFCAMGIILFANSPYAVQATIILTLMGLGELGLEGSSLVENTERSSKGKSHESLRVNVGGFMFLAANWFLGFFLLLGSPSRPTIYIFGAAFVVYLFFDLFLTKVPDLDDERKFQARGYFISILIVLTGAISKVISGGSTLAKAAFFLIASDSLVMFRMGAPFDKKTRFGFITRLILLITILVLYYTFLTFVIIRSVPIQIQ